MPPAGEGTDVAAPVADSDASASSWRPKPAAAKKLRNVPASRPDRAGGSFGRPGIVDGCAVHALRGFIAGAIVLVMPLDTVAVASRCWSG